MPVKVAVVLPFTVYFTMVLLPILPKFVENVIGVPSGICPDADVSTPLEFFVRSAVIIEVPPNGITDLLALIFSTSHGSKITEPVPIFEI
ncbi:MAG: hypothetical protein FJ150_10030 [Euryarchaeota archaeon]|nr:hypothetical protein [Euryarchaeota archaeon]